MFLLNMAMTCSSTHARDTAQLSPGVGGGDDHGERPACSHTPSLQVERTAWHREAGMQEGLLLLLFARTSAVDSLIMLLVLGMDQKVVSFPLGI